DLRDVAHRAEGLAAQGHCALRDRVVEVRQRDGERFEQRMQGGKLRPLDVPMRDFDLTMQIEAVREACVEHIAQRLSGRFTQMTRATVHDGHSPFRGFGQILANSWGFTRRYCRESMNCSRA